MTKYRIVSRNKTPWDSYYRTDYSYYYAQSKLFGMWIDCRYNPFFLNASDSYNVHLGVVEEWVNNQLHRKLPLEEKVVKTYDYD